MKWFLVSALVLGVLVPNAESADDTIQWCYHLPTCNYTTWPMIAAPFCNGTRQSPINIVTASVTVNPNLTRMNFNGFGLDLANAKLENTGQTVKLTLASGIQVTGAGLGEPYECLQFHLHWGNGSSVPGSEHTVDGKRFPMELHVVCFKMSHNGNASQAIADPEGLAALGFLIEALPENATKSPESWGNLTNYFSQIQLSGQSVNVGGPISLTSLLNGTSTDKYYRYNGSLTTPACNEAVIWTVFNDTLKFSADLIDLFANSLHIGNTTSSPFMRNVYRGIQSPLPVQMNAAATPVPTAWMLNTLSLIGLVLLRWRD